MPTAYTTGIADWASLGWGGPQMDGTWDSYRMEAENLDWPASWTTTTFDTSNSAILATGWVNGQVSVENPATWREFSTYVHIQ
jgi:hypothetical protein